MAGTIHQIVNRGGRCLIPVFALGRTQELMLILGLCVTGVCVCLWVYLCVCICLCVCVRVCLRLFTLE
jgi:predicted metal-dependent RNase